ncbi:MAG: hypothetical protein NTU47_00110 [Ignavibacteriales bacterium]|nr:hypothetical protein [Ignavibacteriales bacterium]
MRTALREEIQVEGALIHGSAIQSVAHIDGGQIIVEQIRFPIYHA